MGSTYHKLCYHWVCATKNRRRLIRSEWRRRFHEYLSGTLRGLKGVALIAGGVEDHVHMLIGLKPVHCISDVVRELKKASACWAIRECDAEFQWQEGYSIFSISARALGEVTDYIAHQEEHHRAMSFEDELKTLLEKHGVDYDPKYLL